MDQPYDALIDHAERYWKAEEENARRLASRVNLLLTGGIAVVGVGIYRASVGLSHPGGQPSIVAWTILVLLGLGLVLLAAATWMILWIPRTDRPGAELDASHELRLGQDFLASLRTGTAMTSEAVFERVFSTTYAAANELAERNLRRSRTVDGGQRAMLAGLLLIGLAMTTYTLSGWVHERSEASDGTRGQDVAVSSFAPIEIRREE